MTRPYLTVGVPRGSWDGANNSVRESRARLRRSRESRDEDDEEVWRRHMQAAVAKAQQNRSAEPAEDGGALQAQNLPHEIRRAHSQLPLHVLQAPMRLLRIDSVLQWGRLPAYEDVEAAAYLETPYGTTTEQFWDSVCVVSWTWAEPKPELYEAAFSPMPAEQLRRFLMALKKEVTGSRKRYLWIDWCCMPQYSSEPVNDLLRSKLYFARAAAIIVVPDFRPVTAAGIVKGMLKGVQSSFSKVSGMSAAVRAMSLDGASESSSPAGGSSGSQTPLASSWLAGPSTPDQHGSRGAGELQGVLIGDEYGQPVTPPGTSSDAELKQRLTGLPSIRQSFLEEASAASRSFSPSRHVSQETRSVLQPPPDSPALPAMGSHRRSDHSVPSGTGHSAEARPSSGSPGVRLPSPPGTPRAPGGTAASPRSRSLASLAGPTAGSQQGQVPPETDDRHGLPRHEPGEEACETGPVSLAPERELQAHAVQLPSAGPKQQAQTVLQLRQARHEQADAQAAATGHEKEAEGVSQMRESAAALLMLMSGEGEGDGDDRQTALSGVPLPSAPRPATPGRPSPPGSGFTPAKNRPRSSRPPAAQAPSEVAGASGAEASASAGTDCRAASPIDPTEAALQMRQQQMLMGQMSPAVVQQRPESVSPPSTAAPSWVKKVAQSNLSTSS